jgi:uncharacterized protein (DUF2249 family)
MEATIPDHELIATHDLLNQIATAFEDHQWSDDRKTELLLKVNDGRAKKGQPAVTKWTEVTCGQIRWAIGQVK